MRIKKSLCGSFVISVAAIPVVVALFPSSAYADGKYFPQKAYKVAPAIPTQRAIVVYRDGTEKLTIESSLDGQGREFGWVIPLPSKTSEFKEVSPGLIKTLSLAVQPDIIHNRNMEPFLPIVLLVLLTCLVMAITRPPHRLYWLILILFFFGAWSMPHLGRFSSMTGLAGIKVQDIQEIGSYELAVLEAENADAFNRWLEDNDFAGPTEDDREIISDYIDDGWCFVAAKLRREKEGYSRPHPLSMSFAVETPVYPVRLTATTGGDLYLELFVIADKKAACENLTLEVSDAFDLEETKVRGVFQEGSLPGFKGITYHQQIGHPEIHGQMWNGCVLSRLCGTLKPDQMREDITLQLEQGDPYQKRYHSRQGAMQKGLMYSLLPWCVFHIVLTAIFFRKGAVSAKTFIFVSRVVTPALLFSLLTWGLTYAILPKVEVGKTFHRFYDLAQRKQRAVEVSYLAGQHDHFAGMSKDEIARLLEDYYASKGSANPYTDEPIQYEDSPGNYTILEDERGIVWRMYTMQGYPDDCVLTSPFQN